MKHTNNFVKMENNNYTEFYERNSNVIRRWKFNYRDNLWYEFCPDYTNLTIGRFLKTGRSNYKPLIPIKYEYIDNYGNINYY